eukprot:TRINITY_DN2418_c0_g1_i1.p1 TRINITY_DN2418_c0_g1~~TRINITY_DN2418_c0_g1_i1.p1  ORF type:complete len:640 (+),score=97.02 TRINITY_DN2418_c0_g1_i1:116-2035(+)
MAVMAARSGAATSYVVKNLVLVVVFCSLSGYYSTYKESIERMLPAVTTQKTPPDRQFSAEDITTRSGRPKMSTTTTTEELIERLATEPPEPDTPAELDTPKVDDDDDEVISIVGEADQQSTSTTKRRTTRTPADFGRGRPHLRTTLMPESRQESASEERSQTGVFHARQEPQALWTPAPRSSVEHSPSAAGAPLRRAAMQQTQSGQPVKSSPAQSVANNQQLRETDPHPTPISTSSTKVPDSTMHSPQAAEAATKPQPAKVSHVAAAPADDQQAPPFAPTSILPKSPEKELSPRVLQETPPQQKLQTLQLTTLLPEAPKSEAEPLRRAQTPAEVSSSSSSSSSSSPAGPSAVSTADVSPRIAPTSLETTPAPRCAVPTVTGASTDCKEGGSVSAGTTCVWAADPTHTCTNIGAQRCTDGGFPVTPSCLQKCTVPRVTGASVISESGCRESGFVSSGTTCTWKAQAAYSCLNIGAQLCDDGAFSAIPSCRDASPAPDSQQPLAEDQATPIASALAASVMPPGEMATMEGTKLQEESPVISTQVTMTLAQAATNQQSGEPPTTVASTTQAAPAQTSVEPSVAIPAVVATTPADSPTIASSTTQAALGQPSVEPTVAATTAIATTPADPTPLPSEAANAIAS